MIKLDNLMESIDRRIDRTFGPWYGFFKEHFTIFSVTLLALLLVTSVFKVFYSKPRFIATVIQKDLNAINKTLETIDQECNILSLAGKRTILDFFTVKKFYGSVIGGINLAYPKKWHGPYLQTNPTLNQKFYELVKAKDGIFIVPGKGVHLPNGYIVGKDFSITPDTNITQMLAPRGYLAYKGFPLARRITFKIGDWDSTKKFSEETMQEINSLLQEFNQAMPFTQNESTVQQV